MMRLRLPRTGPRQRYIVRHGIWPWGTLAGVAAGITVVWNAARQSAGGVSVGVNTLVGLGVFCAVMWTAIVGYVVGAFLWETRDRKDTATRPRAD